jgi:hypothetical protein
VISAVVASVPRSLVFDLRIAALPFLPPWLRQACGQFLHFFPHHDLLTYPRISTVNLSSDDSFSWFAHAHSIVINFLNHPFTASGLLNLASAAQYLAPIRATLIIPPTSCSILLQPFMDSLGPLLLLRLRTTGHRLFHPFGLYVAVSSPLPRAE